MQLQKCCESRKRYIASSLHDGLFTGPCSASANFGNLPRVHSLTGLKASTTGQYFSVSFHINQRVVVWLTAYGKKGAMLL